MNHLSHGGVCEKCAALGTWNPVLKGLVLQGCSPMTARSRSWSPLRDKRTPAAQDISWQILAPRHRSSRGCGRGGRGQREERWEKGTWGSLQDRVVADPPGGFPKLSYNCAGEDRLQLATLRNSFLPLSCACCRSYSTLKC